MAGTVQEVYAFKDRATADTLRRMAKERMNHPSGNFGFDATWSTWGPKHGRIPGRQLHQGRALLVCPIKTIPAARVIKTKVKSTDEAGVTTTHLRYRLRLGSGMCVIHRRDQDGTADSWIEAQDGKKRDTRVQRDGDSKAVAVRVYNFCTKAVRVEQPALGKVSGENVTPGPMLYVVQDMWGDFYIVETCPQPGSSSESSFGSQGQGGPGQTSQSGCDFTGTFLVGKGDVRRVGDYLHETQLKLTFRDGKLCTQVNAGTKKVYLCCPGSTSGGLFGSNETSLQDSFFFQSGFGSTSIPGPPPSSEGCCGPDGLGLFHGAIGDNISDEKCDACELLIGHKLHRDWGPLGEAGGGPVGGGELCREWEGALNVALDPQGGRGANCQLALRVRYDQSTRRYTFTAKNQNEVMVRYESRLRKKCYNTREEQEADHKGHGPYFSMVKTFEFFPAGNVCVWPSQFLMKYLWGDI